MVKGESNIITILKQEIIELKVRQTAIEAKLNELGLNATPASKISEFGGEVGEDGFPTGPVKLKGFNGADSTDSTYDLVEATYTIRTVSTAMRGYLEMLDDMGLSRNQKQLVRDLENVMMMAVKLATTIKLLQLTLTTAIDPSKGLAEALLFGFSAGGTMAGSLAYGSKVTGGNI